MQRKIVIAAVVASALSRAVTGWAAAPDLASADGQLAAMRRIQCSARDAEPVTYYWHGHAFSRVPGERDRRLFRVEGMNIRQCGPLPGAKNPAEFRLVSREILLYEDPATGAVLRTWDNPWTGQQVQVLHVANDPVNSSFAATGRDGQPVRLPFSVSGEQWWLTSTVPLFYKNPLGGEYQQYVGGTYHATEMFNFFGEADDLADLGHASARVQVGWVRMSSWLPWMEMGDRAGLMYFHTAGRKLGSWDELSDTMKAEIRENYPDYVAPPPLDDTRPNETSWTYFKKRVDGGARR